MVLEERKRIMIRGNGFGKEREREVTFPPLSQQVKNCFQNCFFCDFGSPITSAYDRKSVFFGLLKFSSSAYDRKSAFFGHLKFSSSAYDRKKCLFGLLKFSSSAYDRKKAFF